MSVVRCLTRRHRFSVEQLSCSVNCIRLVWLHCALIRTLDSVLPCGVSAGQCHAVLQ